MAPVCHSGQTLRGYADTRSTRMGKMQAFRDEQMEEPEGSADAGVQGVERYRSAVMNRCRN